MSEQNNVADALDATRLASKDVAASSEYAVNNASALANENQGDLDSMSDLESLNQQPCLDHNIDLHSLAASLQDEHGDLSDSMDSDIGSLGSATTMEKAAETHTRDADPNLESLIVEFKEMQQTFAVYAQKTTSESKILDSTVKDITAYINLDLEQSSTVGQHAAAMEAEVLMDGALDTGSSMDQPWNEVRLAMQKRRTETGSFVSACTENANTVLFDVPRINAQLDRLFDDGHTLELTASKALTAVLRARKVLEESDTVLHEKTVLATMQGKLELSADELKDVRKAQLHVRHAELAVMQTEHEFRFAVSSFLEHVSSLFDKARTLNQQRIDVLRTGLINVYSQQHAYWTAMTASADALRQSVVSIQPEQDTKHMEAPSVLSSIMERVQSTVSVPHRESRGSSFVQRLWGAEGFRRATESAVVQNKAVKRMVQTLEELTKTSRVHSKEVLKSMARINRVADESCALTFESVARFVESELESDERVLFALSSLANCLILLRGDTKTTLSVVDQGKDALEKELYQSTDALTRALKTRMQAQQQAQSQNDAVAKRQSQLQVEHAEHTTTQAQVQFKKVQHRYHVSMAVLLHSLEKDARNRCDTVTNVLKEASKAFEQMVDRGMGAAETLKAACEGVSNDVAHLDQVPHASFERGEKGVLHALAAMDSVASQLTALKDAYSKSAKSMRQWFKKHSMKTEETTAVAKATNSFESMLLAYVGMQEAIAESVSIVVAELQQRKANVKKEFQGAQRKHDEVTKRAKKALATHEQALVAKQEAEAALDAVRNRTMKPKSGTMRLFAKNKPLTREEAQLKVHQSVGHVEFATVAMQTACQDRDKTIAVLLQTLTQLHMQAIEALGSGAQQFAAQYRLKAEAVWPVVAALQSDVAHINTSQELAAFLDEHETKDTCPPDVLDLELK